MYNFVQIVFILINIININHIYFRLQSNIPMPLNNCCIIMRFLYDVALDSFDKPNFSAIKSPNFGRQNTPQVVILECSYDTF